MTTLDDRLVEAHQALREKRWSEAEACAHQILLESPTNPAALCVLASAHDDRGDEAEAFRLFRQAIAVDPRFEPAYRALLRRYYVSGRREDGAEVYRAWSQWAPSDPEVSHMIAALSGADIPARCSDSYVRTHFDRFAEVFDDVLIGKLAYRGPEIVGRLLAKHTTVREPNLEILDAGCGTGLCGPLIRPYSKRLVGVDLSRRMIERAGARSCYDELVEGEITAFLQDHLEAFDAIVSSDVFIYFGDVASIVGAAAVSLKQGGLLIATCEALIDDGDETYRLQSSGRYAHRASYLRNVMIGAGFALLALEDEFLRWEGAKRVPSYSIAARKL